MISKQIAAAVRDVPDFPKPGIVFKDITPVLSDPKLCDAIIAHFVERYQDQDLDAVVGLESRGFLFGMSLAQKLNLPFVPVRKKGKLPHDVISYSYDLEYGSATVEIHKDALKPGMKVLIHDDLLATGGTAVAAAELVKELGAIPIAFAFIIGLSFLKGDHKLKNYTNNIYSIISY
jgi:adenine phosphoribosyltransferase